MNVPNLLTLSRFVFAAMIIVLLLNNTFAGNVAATVLFVIASITDYYDGYLAKKLNLISSFGQIMDPIADKFLMICIFAVLSFLGMIDSWMVMVIALREIVVTMSRLRALQKGHVLAAEKAGKIKTVFQIVTIIAILLFLIFERGEFSRDWFYKIEDSWKSFIQSLMVASVFITVGSGLGYFRNKWKNEQTSSI